jgi:RNA polymerase sigma-70 factor (ECF subfamily)
VDQVTHLLLEARDGDRDAFAAVVRLCERRVTRFVSTAIDADDVDDVVQDTFVRVWGAVSRYRAEASGLGWILSIARRACADAVRSRRRRRGLLERCAATRTPTVVDDSSERIALDELVATLPPLRREAFALTQLVGLSYEEAARVGEVPIGTIRSRVARARLDLLGAHRRASA